MAGYDIDALVRDPDFQGRSFSERRAILKEADADGFGTLPESAQSRMLVDMKGQDWWQGGKYKAQTGNMSPTAAESEAFRQKVVRDEGTNSVRLRDANRVAWQGAKDKLKSTRKGLADLVRPSLEGAGTIAGESLGAVFSPVTAGASIPALGGLGYAAGSGLSDVIEGKPTTLAEMGQDVIMGGNMVLGGRLLAPAAGYTLSKLTQAKNAVSRATPAVTKAGIDRKAGQIIAENTGQSAVYEKNAAESAKVKIPGYKPSIGEARNDPALIKLQRGIEAQPGTAGNTIIEQRAANQAAVKDYLENEFTGNESIDDVVTALTRKKAEVEATTKQMEQGAAGARGALNPADSQTVGRGISDELDTAIAPLKASEREAWSKVPNYPIPTTNFDEAAHALKNTPLEADTEIAVNKIIDYANRMEKTTEGLQSIERTINDKMFAPNADPNVKRVLGNLKRAIGEDFKAMGEAADVGDIALFEGKVVHPSRLKTDLANIEGRIAEEETKTAVMDVDAMRKELMAKGVPAMKQMAETAEAYTSRLAKDYERAFKKAPPTVQGESKAMADLVGRRDAIANQLDNLQPADDVATAYRAAKDVSKERFDRFGKGAISDVTKGGNQANGLKLPDSAIPAKVFSMDGADDFIRAVGKDKAATHADQYAAQDLLSKANPLSGEIDAKTVASWLKKNMPILRKYGISEKYSTVAKAQARLEIARANEVEFSKSAASRILNADVDKALGSAFSSNPSNTAAVVDGLMKQIGQDKAGLKGLQNAFKDFLADKIKTTAKTLAGDNIISPASIQKELAKYAPAMRRLYANDPGKIAALHKVSKAVEIQARSAKTPVIGSSGTGENVNMARSILGRVVDIVPGGGFTRALAKAGLGKLNDLTAQEVNKVIAKALYDPELAQTLMMAARRKPAQSVEKQINSHLVTMGLIAVKNVVEE